MPFRWHPGEEFQQQRSVPKLQATFGLPKAASQGCDPISLIQNAVSAGERLCFWRHDSPLPYKATAVTHRRMWGILSALLNLSLTVFFWFPMQADTKCYPDKRLSPTDFTSLRWIILSKQYEAVVLSSVANLHLNISKMLMLSCCKLHSSSLFSEEPSLNCLPYLLARFSGSIMLTSLCRFQTELT